MFFSALYHRQASGGDAGVGFRKCPAEGNEKIFAKEHPHDVLFSLPMTSGIFTISKGNSESLSHHITFNGSSH